MPKPAPTPFKDAASPKTKLRMEAEGEKNILVSMARCNSCGDEFYGINAHSQAITHWITWHRVRPIPLPLVPPIGVSLPEYLLNAVAGDRVIPYAPSS